MRILPFAPSDTRRYKILHRALIFSPKPLKRDELLPHGRLLEALLAIGERLVPPGAMDDNPDVAAAYRLADVGGTVLADEGQYQLLRRHLEATISTEALPKAWSLDVDATATWLDAIVETKNEDIAR